MQSLKKRISGIHRKSYGSYKEIKGRYHFDKFDCEIDYVQGDPFAAPSRINLYIPFVDSTFPEHCVDHPDRRLAFEDYLARKFKIACQRHVKGHRGSGKSGLISIECSGQEVLQRNAVLVNEKEIETRILMGLPADGRRILADQASEMFFNELPRIVQDALYFDSAERDDLLTHLHSIQDQQALRAWLDERNLVAFIANGSLLPRKSGVDDKPLSENVIQFESPVSLQQTVALPNRGEVKGMGIPVGVTLIVGGGFHGKSTLLNALEKGVYNHIPGDGRELLASQASAVKIRAEDGRVIHDVDISDFIDHLPFAKDTRRFSTENASGSTSQAANIVEAIHAHCRVMLIDEDTSASNFMIRDETMQALVARDKEPITPLIHRVRELYEKKNISSVIVMGGSGDYLGISDTVIMLDAYRVLDVTQKAHSIARSLPIPENLPAKKKAAGNTKTSTQCAFSKTRTTRGKVRHQGNSADSVWRT